jgi:hypothetical protein
VTTELDQVKEELRQANEANAAAETEKAEAISRAEAAEAKLKEAETAGAVEESKAQVQKELSEALSKVALPEVVKERIQSRFKDATSTDGMAEAIREEADYLKKMSGAGVVVDMGESDDEKPKPAATKDALTEAFKGLGLSDEGAAVALAGRN